MLVCRRRKLRTSTSSWASSWLPNTTSRWLEYKQATTCRYQPQSHSSDIHAHQSKIKSKTQVPKRCTIAVTHKLPFHFPPLLEGSMRPPHHPTGKRHGLQTPESCAVCAINLAFPNLLKAATGMTESLDTASHAALRSTRLVGIVAFARANELSPHSLS